MTHSRYRGRFAPSPTGPLHFGSLVTALASYLEARTREGEWLVRIEDLDPLRESPEASDRILTSLNAHQLIADQPVRWQSRRHKAYDTALARLLETGHAYYCICSRKQLNANDGRHVNDCRQRRTLPEQPYSIRFALQEETACWEDQLLGPQKQLVTAGVDDPVLQRKEGFYAYQLAVVVDDIEQQITNVVRGSDLQPLTAQQQQIFRALGAEPPLWFHIPVILNRQGQKLSKQTHAPAIEDSRPTPNLVRALQALGQCPPDRLSSATQDQVLAWAITHWQAEQIPRQSHSESDIT